MVEHPLRVQEPGVVLEGRSGEATETVLYRFGCCNINS